VLARLAVVQVLASMSAGATSGRVGAVLSLVLRFSWPVSDGWCCFGEVDDVMATETVTVLFTDVVGSTELLSRVGEVAAEELRREHFGLLRTAIDEAGGREVKNLGDGLMVAFNGVGAALACAVSMQQSVSARPDGVEPLAIRVGVATGEVDVDDDGDCFGLPVVEAARLCAAAEGGEILVTGLVRLLARSRGGFDLVSVGELDLKGLVEPVEAFRVGWEPVAAAGDVVLPVPQRVVSLATSRFVGRETELEFLAGALKEVWSGDRRAVLLSGEPGIGKTTLAASFAVNAAAGGVTVVYGRCDEDLFVPFQPWVEALGFLVEHASDEVIRAHVEACGSVLGRVVPQVWRRAVSYVADAGPGSDESDRALLFAAVVDLLGRASERAALVVVLDDLHWADAATVQLLRHVVTANRSLRVLVVGTFRDSDVGADHVLADALAAMHREHGVHRVPLGGLGDDELLHLLELVAGHEMNDDGVALRDALRSETDGNPFFVGEMLQHLSDTGALYQDDAGRWAATDQLRQAGLPVSIREVVGRRVIGLGVECHRVLTMGSVIGRDFELDVLEKIVDIDADRLIDLCDAAVAAGILGEGERGGYTFAHALIERALYDGLSGNRRALAHRAVAEALEHLHGDHPDAYAGQLAYHWANAVRPSDTGRAVEYALLAGDRAMVTLAPEEALRWYTQALELLDTDPAFEPEVRARLLAGLGDAQRLCGVPEYRDTLLHAARLADRVDNVELLVRAVLANHRGFQSSVGTVDTERVEVIDRALERLGDNDMADRARLLAHSCMEKVNGASLNERLRIAVDAVATARRSGDPAALSDTLTRVCTATLVVWTLDRRTIWSDEACRIADTLGDPSARFYAHFERFICALECGDLETLRTHTAVMDEISERVPHAALRWYNHAFARVVPMVVAGDLDGAEQLASDALALGVDSGQPDAMTIYGAFLISTRLRQGRLGELLPVIEQVAADNPGLPAFGAALAVAYIEVGDDDRARRIFEEARDLGFRAPEDITWSSLHYSWSELAVHFGDRVAAEVLHDRLAPFADQIITTRATVSPAIGHYVAKLEHLLGRHEDADASFRRALAIHEQLEAPAFIAMTQVAWAAMLADCGHLTDLDHARTLATNALQVAEQRRYGATERDARAVLHSIDGHSTH
jgi:class 3 adenylate cyclase/tetratricopeptide (TPR) repeat protein